MLFDNKSFSTSLKGLNLINTLMLLEWLLCAFPNWEITAKLFEDEYLTFSFFWFSFDSEFNFNISSAFFSGSVPFFNNNPWDFVLFNVSDFL